MFCDWFVWLHNCIRLLVTIEWCVHLQCVMGRIKTPQKDTYFPIPQAWGMLPHMARRIMQLRLRGEGGMILN